MFQAQVWKFAKTLKQHRRYSTEKGVFKVFSKFTGKHQRWSLFFNCNFIKKRLQCRCFPMNFVKYVRTLFLLNTSGWLLLKKWTYIQVLVWESMSWCDSSTIISYQQLSNRTLTILQLLDKFDKVFTMRLTSITQA